jgi:hypothetical protein
MKYLSCQILSNLTNQKYLPKILAKKSIQLSIAYLSALWVVGGLGVE